MVTSQEAGPPRGPGSAPAERIGLVGCVKRKAPVALPAQDLYVSALFRGRRRYVEAACHRWYILSALHGLVAPDTILEPYDESLVNKPRAARREWAERVLAQLDNLKLNYSATVFELHAGDAYRSFGLAAGLEARGAAIQNPTAGMTQGHQLAFYKAALRTPGGSV